MPYIDLRKQQNGWAMIETVCENFDKFTKKEIKRATLVNNLLSSSNGWAMIETVRENFNKFTKKEIERATLARKIQAQNGDLPDARFKKILMLGERDLTNCLVTAKDIDNACALYGPNISRLKGAVTRQPVQHTKTMGERLKIPGEFYWLHKFVTLTVDMMFVCRLPFLVTYSKRIRLTTAEFVPCCTAWKLDKFLMKVVKMYARGGSVVNLALMDMEFVKVVDLVGLLEINTTAAREHVAEIEQRIRVVKERT